MSAAPNSASRAVVDPELCEKVNELARVRKRLDAAKHEEKLLKMEVAERMEAAGVRTVSGTDGTVYFQHKQYYAKVNPEELRKKLGADAEKFLVDVVDEKALEEHAPAVLRELRKVEREEELVAFRASSQGDQ